MTRDADRSPDDRRGERPPVDAPSDETAAAGSRFPYTWGAGWGWSMTWPPIYRREAIEEGPPPEEETVRPTDQRDTGSWWGEGLASLLLIAGVILFFIPEPITSTLGILLLILGAFVWIVDALR